MNTKYARILLTALSISALVLAGCGDDDEDSSNPTGSTDTKPGANAPITQANAQMVWAQAFQSIAQAQAQAGQGGTVNGTNSGKATVKTSSSATGVTYTITFDDFSNDGLNWIDGPLTIKASTTGSFTYTGKLTISGQYSGVVELNLSGGAAGVTGTIKTGGQTITVG
ncbi:MAG: hypothetical protein IT369_05175 [Candidatus Latescibacteria bacterium]|nr:hypothetical protein [Candidatus Latescibacterota bacterium]